MLTDAARSNPNARLCMVRLTLLINILALGVVLAMLLQLELPAKAGVTEQATALVSQLGSWARSLWDMLAGWADQIAPSFESAWETVAAWAKAAAQWALERLEAVSDWIASKL
mgnify:CR=1 FL=1